MIVTPGQFNRRAELYHQMGSMISAGIPLIRSLEMASNNAGLRASRKTILELVRYLQAGLTFSESMKQVHGWMPEFDMALLSAGEQAGRLDTSFKTLAAYYATRAQIIRDTLSRMVVTIMTLHVFLFIFPLGLFISFVLGIMNNQYAQCIPFLVEKAIVFGALYFLTFVTIYASQGARGEKWRATVEFFTQMVPILRTAQKYLVLARLSAALHSLITSGVSIIKSWELSAAASGSPRLKHDVANWFPQLESGTTPAELVNQTRYFPQMFANLYQTGEISGQLDDSLLRLQNYYREEGFRALQFFARIMTGTIYGLVALCVAIFVIRFYVGYFTAALNAF